MNSDLMSLITGNITDYVLKQQIKIEAENNMNEGQGNIEKVQDNMEDIQDSMEDIQDSMEKIQDSIQVRRFFDSLPKFQSHYCRKDSSKLYFEPHWTSKSQLYNAYKDDFCPREKMLQVSVTFLKTLICHCFGQKKDLCDVCESFETGNITESEHKMHNDMKKETRTQFVKDTASSNEVFATDFK
ncbi:uncharacterized protein TNCV_4223711 [Trichonephila clavipes]|nr:uncharacterized protein TNCV_4223711 [Trichonephila clavipes]